MLKHNKDDWEFISDIGEGQYGKVIKCRKKNGFINNDQVDYVAIKIISKNKFRKNETDILEKIRLFNIPKFYGHAEDNEFIYIYMECINGENVANILHRKGRFKEKRIISMVADLTETLSFLHKHHVIHRDIKTANLVLEFPKKNLKLIDFGASIIENKKDLEPYLNNSNGGINTSLGLGLSGSGNSSYSNRQLNISGEKQSSFAIIGTFNYMAPEVKRNYRATRKSDVYSLGCTIVEMAGGDLTKRTDDGLPIIPDHVSDTLRDFINHCLVIDPKKRSYMEDLLNHKLISSIIGPNKSKNYNREMSFDEDDDDNNNNNNNNENENSNDDGADDYHSSRFPAKFAPQYEKPKWEIEFEELEFEGDESVKGAGNFGDVKKALLNETEVAVKFVRKAHSNEVTVCDTFYHEVLILSNLRHPNIVQFMAACIKYGEKETYHCIVSEWMSGGNLRQFYTNHHQILTRNPHLRVKLALDIAKGLLYLHKQHPPIIHRDLTSNNVLLDFKRELNSNQTYGSNEFTAKVCDFGLSSNKSELKKIRGSIHYLAPENLKGEKLDEKSDVYAFGLLVWELFSFAPPNTIYSPKEMANMVEKMDYRPSIPYNVPQNFKEIIVSCWDKNPSVRPTFTIIIEKLKVILSTFSKSNNSNNTKSNNPSLLSILSTLNNNNNNFNSTNSSNGSDTTSYSKIFGGNSSGGCGDGDSDSNCNSPYINEESSPSSFSSSSPINTNLLKTLPKLNEETSQMEWETKLKQLDIEHEKKLSNNNNSNNNDDDINFVPTLPNDLGYC